MTIYLILHKVRGEPQFDIAEPLDGQEGADALTWIIPTSGHRAHPMFTWRLFDTTKIDVLKSYQHAAELPRWHDLPDHYSAAVPRPSVRERFSVDDL